MENASIDGQDISARSLRLSHARLLNWRPDRSIDNCIVDKLVSEVQQIKKREWTFFHIAYINIEVNYEKDKIKYVFIYKSMQ